jgi:hypothetical protein
MKHGEIRNHRTETTFAPTETWKTTDGQPVLVIPSSLTHTVSERFCERCGWIEQRGVMGALTWIALHEDHGGSAVRTDGDQRGEHS